jgi:hypothetical protein
MGEGLLPGPHWPASVQYRLKSLDSATKITKHREDGKLGSLFEGKNLSLLFSSSVTVTAVE